MGNQVNQLEHPLHALADASGRDTADLQPEGDVLFAGHLLEQRLVLEHDAELPFLRRNSTCWTAFQVDLTGVGLIEPREDAEEGCLAASRWTKHDEDLPARDFEAHLMEDFLIAERLGESVDSQDRRGQISGAGPKSRSGLSWSSFRLTLSERSSARKASRLARIPGTIGPGQSVPHRSLSATVSRRGK